MSDEETLRADARDALIPRCAFCQTAMRRGLDSDDYPGLDLGMFQRCLNVTTPVPREFDLCGSCFDGFGGLLEAFFYHGVGRRGLDALREQIEGRVVATGTVPGVPDLQCNDPTVPGSKA